ncbi:hypothetical protein IEQ34_004515 [Dendrobium chrysotoxum]|uniref:Uncharacterized protein n=1 Tax=Dendrobium chrysotoxum TaxID=161865 RepID=A0AAV7HEI2_DENCH|nr:hypothetical protein IEQ34_004515 [Dendrobium chrysotoxum]
MFRRVFFSFSFSLSSDNGMTTNLCFPSLRLRPTTRSRSFHLRDADAEADEPVELLLRQRSGDCGAMFTGAALIPFATDTIDDDEDEDSDPDRVPRFSYSNINWSTPSAKFSSSVGSAFPPMRSRLKSG